MTIIENRMDEFLDVRNLDKVRTVGSLSGWQRQVYNVVTNRLAHQYLDRMMEQIYKIIPEDADPNETKETLKLILMEYIDSVL